MPFNILTVLVSVEIVHLIVQLAIVMETGLEWVLECVQDVKLRIQSLSKLTVFIGLQPDMVGVGI